jgi:hypothetical protein
VHRGWGERLGRGEVRVGGDGRVALVEEALLGGGARPDGSVPPIQATGTGELRRLQHRGRVGRGDGRGRGVHERRPAVRARMVDIACGRGHARVRDGRLVGPEQWGRRAAAHHAAHHAVCVGIGRGAVVATGRAWLVAYDLVFERRYSSIKAFVAFPYVVPSSALPLPQDVPDDANQSKQSKDSSNRASNNGCEVGRTALIRLWCRCCYAFRRRGEDITARVGGCVGAGEGARREVG